MGGNGAKERRKLQRHQKLQEQAATSTESAGSEVKSKTVPRDVAPAAARKHIQHNNRKPRGNPNILNRNKYPRAVGKPVKKEKKFKKPKHLKRKLELAVDDDDVKEKIQAELETFMKTKKQKVQKTQHNVQARKKEEKSPPSNSSMIVQSQGREEKEQEVEEVEEQAFPRIGNTIANKKAASSSESGNAAQKSTKSNDSSQLEAKNNASNSHANDRDDDDDGGDDDGDDDDDDDLTEFHEKRTRGRRRRGRQGRNTSDIVKEQQDQNQEEQKPGQKIMDQSTSSVGEQSESRKEENDSNSRSDEDSTEITDRGKKETKKDRRAIKDDGRYCIGRKPCTDFAIGKKYSGKVVYVKPFGIFLDIGCHSDAFCHVSRLSDDYIENPSDQFKEGDTIESVRVVEIDRKSKRLTVSLQSETRIADEQASIDARQKRRERHQSKKKVKTTDQSRIGSSHQTQKNHEYHGRRIESDSGRHTSFGGHNGDDRERENQFSSHSRSSPTSSIPSHQSTMTAAATSTTIAKPESGMSHVELKRARKLARRAARRDAATGVEAQ